MKVKFLVAATMLALNLISYGQYCPNQGDCRDFFLRIAIGNRTYTTNALQCNNNGGYEYFSNDTIYLLPGDALPVEVESDQFLETGVDLYLDTNLNGQWEADDERTILAGPGALVIEYGALIAATDQRPGLSRLRVISYNLADAPSDPCNTAAYHVVDFPVVFGRKAEIPKYCRATGNCGGTMGYHIQRVQLDGENGTKIDNTTPNSCEVYADYTQLRAEVLGGNDYNISITAQQNMFYGVAAVWVDWNNNGDFEATETFQAIKKTDFSGYDATITAPDSGFVSGLKRMRVRNTMLLTTPEPCDSLNNGEVEDYTLLYINPEKPIPSCPVLLMPSNAASNVCLSSVLGWRSSPGATGYRIRLRTATATVINNLTTTDTTQAVNNLNPNTEYFWDVTAYNENGDAIGCGSFSFTTSVNNDPKITLGPANQIQACAGDQTALTSVVQDGTAPFSYAWVSDPSSTDQLFDDNTLSNPSFQSTPGTFTLSCTASDANGCKATASLVITVNAKPDNRMISVAQPTLCAGTATSLTIQPALGAGLNLTWQDSTSGIAFANSSRITGSANPYTCTPNAAQQFFRAVIVDQTTGCRTVSNIVQTEWFPTASIPNVEISPSATPCQGQTVQLSVDWNGTTRWNDANQTSGNILMVNTSGSFIATLTDGNGCVFETDAAVITVLPTPTKPVITASAMSACSGDSVLLSAVSNQPITWLGPEISSGNSFWVKTAGEYTAVATAASGCFSTSDPIAISFNPLPAAPNVVLIGSNPACKGSSVILRASGQGTIQWNDINNTVGPQLNIIESGNYFATLTDANQCTSQSLPTQITIFDLPPAPVISTTTEALCPNETAVLSTQYNTGLVWSNGSTNAQISVQQTGTFSVVFTDVNGCSNTSAPLTIRAGEVPPTPVITQLADTLFGPQATQYQWFDENGAVVGATNRRFEPKKTGFYRLVVFSADGCPSDTSAALFFSGVGISELSELGMVLFPNPATDQLTIQSERNEAFSVTLTNQIGQVLDLPSRSNFGRLTLDISTIPSGLYVARIQLGHTEIQVKVIKP